MNLGVFRGLGNGTFTYPYNDPTMPFPSALLAADFDDDGDADVIVGSKSWLINIFANPGDGLLTERNDDGGDWGIILPARPDGLAAGDFDRDGYLDLAVCSSGTDTVSVLMNANGVATPVLVSRIRHEYENGALTITWSSSSIVDAGVYRNDGTGWMFQGTTGRGSRDELVWVDRDVRPGRTYYYRLGLQDSEGETFTGDFSVAIPAGSTFSLINASTNPTKGLLEMSVTLPNDSSARLSLWDIAGRRLEEIEVGSLGMGSHRVDLGRDLRLAPGVYVVRLEQAHRVASCRVVVAR
jgi:hypothetical protein